MNRFTRSLLAAVFFVSGCTISNNYADFYVEKKIQQGTCQSFGKNDKPTMSLWIDEDNIKEKTKDYHVIGYSGFFSKGYPLLFAYDLAVEKKAHHVIVRSLLPLAPYEPYEQFAIFLCKKSSGVKK